LQSFLGTFTHLYWYKTHLSASIVLAIYNLGFNQIPDSLGVGDFYLRWEDFVSETGLYVNNIQGAVSLESIVSSRKRIKLMLAYPQDVEMNALDPCPRV